VSNSEFVNLSRDDLYSIVHRFSEDHNRAAYTPAEGLSAFHDAVTTAFAHVDVPAENRESVNCFINALQDLYETVDEQDQSASAFIVELEDIVDISRHMDCLRAVICIQHTELKHHDISSSLLWAKTALRKLVQSGWNVGIEFKMPQAA
jgi:hypothetical protein